MKQMRRLNFTVFFLFSFVFTRAQSGYVFGNLDSLIMYADENSRVMKTANEQSLLAKWTKVAAMGNLVNFKSPLSFSVTDNTKLPVSFLPGEPFGGLPGTFKQISLGQQYVSNFNLMPQIDIINLSVWQKLKSADINTELTEVNNLLVKKNLHESIAAAYYNCISYSGQIKIIEQSLSNADSILLVVRNKYDLGISRLQDLNNATINKLNVTDKLNQLMILLDQQYNSLKILCDIPFNTSIVISENSIQKPLESKVAMPVSDLQEKYAGLQSSYLRSELTSNRLSLLPALSFVFYQGWQHNSNSSVFDKAAEWIPSRYVGIKLSLPFPPEVSRLSQNYTSKINWRISQLNAEHMQLQNHGSNESLNLDYSKAASSNGIAKQIMDLKTENYSKSMNQYRESVLSTKELLDAFADMLNSQINYVSTLANAHYLLAKININNTIK